MGLAANVMFKEHRSKYSYEETLVKLGEALLENDFKTPYILDHRKVQAEIGNKKMYKLSVIALCSPREAKQILKLEGNRRMAAMMPMNIAVYEGKDGKCYFSVFNIGLMSKMFGPYVSKQMGSANKALAKVFKGIAAKK